MYAITQADHPVPTLFGFEEAPLRAIAREGLGVVVSDVAAAVEPTEDALRRHEAVVEELMRGGPALPMRFGSAVGDDAAAAAALCEREAEWATGLEGVRGAVELGVRVLWDPVAEPEDPAPGPAGEATAARGAGTAYLMRRLDRDRRSEELADELHAPLAAMARQSTRRLLVTPRLLLSAAYLVEDDEIEGFRDRVDELDADIDEVAVICTGPWPPYSFVPSGASE
jgi:Gas vesicle synthesis protein GvpL/GvpF